MAQTSANYQKSYRERQLERGLVCFGPKWVQPELVAALQATINNPDRLVTIDCLFEDLRDLWGEIPELTNLQNRIKELL